MRLLTVIAGPTLLILIVLLPATSLSQEKRIVIMTVKLKFNSLFPA